MYLQQEYNLETDIGLLQKFKNSICSAKEAKGECLDLNDIKYLIKANIGEVPQETINWNILGGNQVRVGQWMSESEYNNFVKTGIIPRKNVLRNGMEGYIKQAEKGDYYVEFDINESLLKLKNEELGWWLIKPKYDLYISYANKQGIIFPEPVGKNIKHVYTKER